MNPLDERLRNVAAYAEQQERRAEAAEQALQRVRAKAKTMHRARCGDEFTIGYCTGCDMLRALDGTP